MEAERDEPMPGAIWVLAVVAFLVSIGFGVVYPVLPVFARTFGVSNFLVAMVVSAFALMRLLFAPVAGRLVVRLAERSLLVAGVWIVAASSGLAGLATSYGGLLAWRAVGGIGSAMFSISAMGMLLALAPPERRGRASGMFSGGFLLGGMAGPAVGGLLTGISMNAPFFFYAGTLAAAGLVALIALPGGNVARSSSPDGLPILFLTALRDSRFRAAVGSAFAHGWQSQGVRSLLVPLIIVEVLLLEPSWTGIAFGIAAAAQALALTASGWATDRIGRRPLLVAGSAVTAVVGAFFALAGSYVLLVVLLCLYGVGVSMASTAAQATVGDALGRRGGSAIAGYQMAGDVGTIIGPLVAGLLADRLPMTAAFGVGAALLVGSTVLAWLMATTRADR
jgi:MFS family permease